MISGYGAVYYRDDDPDTEYQLWEGMTERIMPGAFDWAIENSDVRGLINHDSNRLLGRTKSGTMKLKTDSVGLHYEITLPDTQDGRDAKELVSRGDMDGSSFAFTVRDQEVVRNEGASVREIREVALFDVGPVTYPAYAATSARSHEVEQSLARVELARHRLTELGIEP